MDALCVESPLQPELDIGNKVFQWKVVRSTLMQARQVMADEIQKYNPDDAMKSFLAPALMNPFHAIFQRYNPLTGEVSIPACPLSTVQNEELAFQPQSDPMPPSPYSDEEIDLDEEEERRGEREEKYEQRMHARHERPRRFSHEPPADYRRGRSNEVAPPRHRTHSSDDARNVYYTKRPRRS